MTDTSKEKKNLTEIIAENSRTDTGFQLIRDAVTAEILFNVGREHTIFLTQIAQEVNGLEYDPNALGIHSKGMAYELAKLRVLSILSRHGAKVIDKKDV